MSCIFPLFQARSFEEVRHRWPSCCNRLFKPRGWPSPRDSNRPRSIRLAERIQTAKRYCMEIGFTERRHRTLLLRLTGDERHAKRSTDKQRETRMAEISLVKVLRHREIQRWARKGGKKKEETAKERRKVKRKETRNEGGREREGGEWGWVRGAKGWVNQG